MITKLKYTLYLMTYIHCTINIIIIIKAANTWSM